MSYQKVFKANDNRTKMFSGNASIMTISIKTDSSKKTADRGGLGSKILKICRRLEWMVPKYRFTTEVFHQL